PAKAKELQDVCTVALNLFRQLAVYLAPVLPRLAKQTGALLGKPIEHWEESQTPLVGTPVSKFEHMMKRVEVKQVEAMFSESKVAEVSTAPAGQAGMPAPRADGPEALAKEPLSPECTFDDF